MNVTINPQNVGVSIESPDMGVRTASPVARYVVEPYIKIEETEDGAVITCTDPDGTTTGTIYNGPQGPQGIQGPQGEQGVQGERGPQGEQGPQGATGATGAQGPQGEQGPQGATGQTGPAGNDGTTFTPSVSADGDLSWTNDGGKTNPATVNIKGPQGETGPAGTTDFNDLTNKPNYALSNSVGGAAELTVAIPYGEIGSTSTSTNLLATVPGVHELKDGVVCYVRNDIVTSASGCTLNINSLGAKPIYVNNADTTRVSTAFSAATTWLFIYNENRVTGGCWDAYYGQVNSNTIGYQLRTNSFTKALSDKCYRYRLLFSSVDGTKFVPANADTQTSAAKTHTTNTRAFDPFGEIFYYGSTSAKSAGESPSATVLWQQYVVTLGYSFNNANSALSLTATAPVYITATPQSDGSAVLDYFSQTLPSTEDGKIYIFLGHAVDATTVEMTMKHPIYWYKDGEVRQWTNAVGGGGVGTPTVYDDSTTFSDFVWNDKTYTVVGDGVVIAYVSSYSSDANDNGTAKAKIAHNGTQIMAAAIAQTSQAAHENGAFCSVPIAVSDGDTITLSVINAHGYQDRQLYRRFLCFGCSVTWS